MRAQFEQYLQKARDEVIRMGSEVQENLFKATDALRRRDQVVSKQIVQADKWINARQIELVTTSLELISTQSPMASDMRFIAAVIEIAGELERIHDYAKGIGKINLLIDDEADIQPLITPLMPMAEKTADMLHQALNIFVTPDMAQAKALAKEDDVVDAFYNNLYETLMDHARLHAQDVVLTNRILWAGHNLERSADRVLNICEWVIYLETGVYEELDDLEENTTAEFAN